MNEMHEIDENRLLHLWTRTLCRRPDQLNRSQESDAELVPLPGGENLLAVTVDTVAEEITAGIFQDPETIGWMGAMVSLSDLAAVGASPLGIVVSVCLPEDAPEGFQAGLAGGLDHACRRVGTFVLGGDTNAGHDCSVTSCAVGLVHRDRVLTRIGCQPGDLLYVTGPLGAGSSAAVRVLLDLPSDLYIESNYRPVARVREAQIIARFATACMDTSDGLLATLDQLMRLNGVGFELERAPVDLLEPRSRAVAHALGVDPLLLLAGHHGEFELVFSIPAQLRDRFEALAADNHLAPLLVGRVIEPICVRLGGAPPRPIDTGRIRNLFTRSADVGEYLTELTRLVAST